MRADDEIRLGVLVDEPRARLQPLPAAVLRLEPVRYHARRSGFQY